MSLYWDTKLIKGCLFRNINITNLQSMKNQFLTTLLILLLSSASLFSQNQNVSINNTGALPDASAMLDISSSEKGLLIPRMNSAQRVAISAPATGLVVYDTSLDGFWFFDGIQWQPVGDPESQLITNFNWLDDENSLLITENGTDWSVYIDNEADDLTDNFINELSNVDANPTGAGQIIEWNGTQWVAGVDDSGSGGATINSFLWSDASDLLTITEGTTDWNVIIDNEADDLTDNLINELVNVNANPTISGQILKWNGSQWVAGNDNEGFTITNFNWNDGSDLLRITEGGTNWDVTIDNEADNLSDNIINDLSNVNALPSGPGQTLKWDGSQWYAGTDDIGSDAAITDFTWSDGTDLLRISEDGTDWDVYLNNEADDLSNNIINDLSNVNANPVSGQVLKWNGSEWSAADDAGSSGGLISAFSWNDGTDLLRITENGSDWDVTINNEADDLSNNFINDLNNVNASPSNGDFLQWNGSQWIAGGGSGSSCVTLEEAYNCGGNGFGRQVSVDYGAIELYLSNTTNGIDAFYAESSTGTSGNPTSGITAYNVGTGAAIYAEVTGTGNQYGAIQGVSNYGTTSSGIYPSGVAGYFDGNGMGVGVWGESTGNGSLAGAGVYGFGINNNFGVWAYSDVYPGLFAETNNINSQALQISSAGSEFGNPALYSVGWLQLDVSYQASCPSIFIDELGGEPTIAPFENGWGFLGTNTVGWYSLYYYNAVQLTKKTNSRNINYLEENSYELIMNDIDNIQPAFYKTKEETDYLDKANESKFRPNMHFGIMLEDAPDYIQDNKFSGIETYSLASLSLAGVKYNREEIKKINETISDFGVIQLSSTQLWVSFNDEFSEKLSADNIPAVTITTNSPNTNVYISKQTNKGFNIVVEGNDSNLMINWMAMAKVDNDQDSDNFKNSISPGLYNQLNVSESIKDRARNSGKNRDKKSLKLINSERTKDLPDTKRFERNK